MIKTFVSNTFQISLITYYFLISHLFNKKKHISFVKFIAYYFNIKFKFRYLRCRFAWNLKKVVRFANCNIYLTHPLALEMCLKYPLPVQDCGLNHYYCLLHMMTVDLDTF